MQKIPLTKQLNQAGESNPTTWGGLHTYMDISFKTPEARPGRRTLRMVGWVLQSVFLLGFASTVSAGNHAEAREWLQRMADAMNQMSYQGTFVYIRGWSVETMRITHVVDEDGVHERLYSITGPQREVLRDKDGVRCVLGDEKSIMEDPVISGAIFPDIPLENLEDENAQYVFSTRQVSRVAGHKTRMVSIKPVDKFRYGYEFWLEEKSGLLLKWVLYETPGKPIARMMFTDLSLGDEIQEEELISPTPPEEFVMVKTGMPAREALSQAKPKWIPSALPPGFKLAAHSVQEQEGNSVFEHLVYSDGLASVSVYVEDRLDNSPAVQGASKIGTANAFSRKIGKKQVTVIGEVPQMTVRSINIAVTPPVINQ